MPRGHSIDSSNNLRVPVLTLVRHGADGDRIRIPIEWKGDDPLPPLQAGDIIEFSWGPVYRKPKDTADFNRYLTWNFRKRISFPVTVEISGKTQEFKLRGDFLSFDPTNNEAPLLSAGHLARLFLPASQTLKPNSILTIRRQGSADIRMDLSASGAGEFELRSGDHLILPESMEAETTDKNLCPVRLIIPGFNYSRTYRPVGNIQITDNPSLPFPTLIQALTDAYSPWGADRNVSGEQAMENRYPEFSSWVQQGDVPVILPHPDFSRIRIKRIGGDGKETVREVDFSDAIRRCAEDTPDAEARKADVALFPGDIIELPLKIDPSASPWLGFTAEEERFFRKALGGTVMVRKQDGIIEPVEISYRQPDWKSTPHGLIPLPPKQGIATTRLLALTDLKWTSLILKRDGHELRFASADPLLRDSDEIAVDVMPQPMQPQRQPRPLVVPPPVPPSN
jgi:hypothetical protein